MILVAAGHDPARQGASFEGHTEFEQAVQWQRLIVQYLGDIGEAVPDGGLRSTVEFINAAQPVLGLEIHFNSAKNSEGVNVGEGCESLYFPGSDRGMQLAQYMQAALIKSFSPDRGVKTGFYQQNPARGVLYFLRKTHPIACILEPQFLQFWEEIESKRAACCMGIAKQLLLLLEDWNML